MTTSSPIRVLVVGEDVATKWVVHDTLEAAGYLVAEALVDKPLLSQLQENQHEWVVVLAGKTSERDGLALLQQIAGEPALIQRHAYLLLTARRQTFPRSVVQVFRQLGVRVLQQPVEPDALTAAVQQVAQRLA